MTDRTDLPTLDEVRYAESQLVEGRWGSREETIRASLRHFTDDLMDSARVNRLHPVAELVVDLVRNGKSLDSGLPLDLVNATASPGVGSDGWKFESTAADSALQHVLEERVAPQRLRVLLKDDEESVVAASLERARGLIPRLSESVFYFVKRQALVESPDLVGSTYVDCPGVILTGTSILNDSDKLMESIFHEALHAKSAKLDQGISTPHADDDVTEEIIPIAWRGENRWGMFRAYDAYYVYAHLTVLRAAELATFDGAHKPAPDLIRKFQRVSFRAEYLYRAVTRDPRGELGDERHEVADWLHSITFEPYRVATLGRDLLARMSNDRWWQ